MSHLYESKIANMGMLGVTVVGYYRPVVDQDHRQGRESEDR